MSDTVNLSTAMSADDLQRLRKTLKFTQAQMSERMGLSKSAYVAIETKTASMRLIHQLAAERVAISELAERDDDVLTNALIDLTPNHYLLETRDAAVKLKVYGGMK